MPISNLTGLTFGRWTVVKRSHVHKNYWCWVCACACGTERVVNGRLLRNGQSKSCGCFWHEQVTIHGMTGSREFKSWESMLQRCTNPNDPSYARYGGVGIKVCKRWSTFENFFSDMGPRPEGTTLDRYPDAEGDYKPKNCRWATSGEQSRNRKNTRMLTYKGRTQMLLDWARELNMPYDLLLRRVNRGLKEDQLFAPSRSKAVSRFQGTQS
jgi:hypothetical protein